MPLMVDRLNKKSEYYKGSIFMSERFKYTKEENMNFEIIKYKLDKAHIYHSPKI